MQMNRLFLFNPENDIALARDAQRFTPPRQAALLHRAGCALPFWLADPGDYILVPEDSVENVSIWMESMGLKGATAVSSAKGLDIAGLAPWGWSRDTVSQFLKAGVDSRLLAPICDMMPRHRALSHRRTALALLEALRLKGVEIGYPLPIEACCGDEIMEYASLNGKVFIKSPWSSSGRGVFPADDRTMASALVRSAGIIASQGSVMVEKALDKVADFAMLFTVVGAYAQFAGYSFFRNSTDTNYGGNFVTSDADILREVGMYIEESRIEQLKDILLNVLPDILGKEYTGPIGIDMMVFRGEDGQLRINPCVEINLRYTMGFVARGIYHRLGRTGWMTMRPKTALESRAVSGSTETGEEPTFSLVPPNPWFDIIFSAQV